MGSQESDTTLRLNHRHRQKQHIKYAGLMIGSGTQFQPTGEVEVERWEGQFPHTHKQFLDTSRMSEDSTQFRYYLSENSISPIS